jgi:hypothetical protein
LIDLLYQLLDVFSSGEQREEGEREKGVEEREAEAEEDPWSGAYANHGVLKPHHFIGSISEIIKKLPEGLQISRVSQK